MQGGGRAERERKRRAGGQKQHLLVVCLIGAGRERACGREREGGGILVITEYGRQRFRSLGLIVISGMKINEQSTLKIDFIKRG